MSQSLTIIPSERVISKIYVIRNKKVMLDKDLAALYGVRTMVLNQAVKRNIKRFPEDFMFQLDKKEFDILKSQNVISNRAGRGGTRKLPYAFTEHGIAMLSSVLNSDRAININIQIIRTFVKIRELLATNESLQRKIMQLERKYAGHDAKIKEIFKIITLLLVDKNKNEIGFNN